MKTIALIALLTLSIGLVAQDGFKDKFAERLNLSTEQVEQFQAIMEERRAIAEQAKEDAEAKLANVLTEEQLAEWSLLQERRQMRKQQRRERIRNFRGEPLNLTDEQKEQLQMVLQDSRDKISLIKDETEASLSTFLTEEELAQVKRKIMFKILRNFRS